MFLCVDLRPSLGFADARSQWWSRWRQCLHNPLADELQALLTPAFKPSLKYETAGTCNGDDTLGSRSHIEDTNYPLAGPVADGVTQNRLRAKRKTANGFGVGFDVYWHGLS